MLKILDHFEEWFIAFLMAAATLIIFAAVIHRYAATIPVLFPVTRLVDMSWAQELCIYLFVWMAKFGAAYGVRSGIHVGVDVAINRLSASWRGRVVLFGLLAGALFTATVGTLGLNLVLRLIATDQVSSDMEAPMWLVYLAVPCGSYLMCLRFLQVAWRFFRTGVLPAHDHAHVAGVAAGEDRDPVLPLTLSVEEAQ